MLDALTIRTAVCAGILTMLTSTPAAADGDSPAEAMLNAPRTLVIGHRGYPQFAPENTIPSWKLAVAAGADMEELDYYHTKDGQLVVMHDPTLDRTTDAVAKWGGSKIRVESKTMAELKTLDAGKWFDPKYAGTKVPTLNEALDTIQGGGGMTLVERKEGDAAACIKLLHDRDLVNKVIVQAFDWDYLTDFHKQEPKQVLGALGPPSTRHGKKLSAEEKILTPAWIDEAAKAGARAVVWNTQVTKEAVAYAHQKQLKVWVYTVNDEAETNRLLDMGVDGLITNNTSLIWRSIALRQTKILKPRIE